MKLAQAWLRMEAPHAPAAPEAPVLKKPERGMAQADSRAEDLRAMWWGRRWMRLDPHTSLRPRLPLLAACTLIAAACRRWPIAFCLAKRSGPAGAPERSDVRRE